MFLDEPTTGLDPRSRLDLWEVIRDRVRAGTTLLLTTQHLEEADVLSDRIAVIDAGRVIAEGSSDELKSQLGGERIEVVVHRSADMGAAREIMARHAATAPTVDEHARRLTAPIEGGSRVLMTVIRDFDAQALEIDEVALRRPTLDDVFFSLTGHAAEVGQAGEAGQAGQTREQQPKEAR